MPEQKIKHLEMIEAAIERMSRNSFQLKGWAMTLVVAILALMAKEMDYRLLLFVLVPLLGFWCLDSFYLQQERKYALLFKNVLDKTEAEIDFNLDNSLATGTEAERQRLNFVRCLFSFSEMVFYLAAIVVVSGVIFIIKCL